MHEVQRSGTQVSGYVSAESLEDAQRLLSEAGGAGRLIAGGTDLLIELARGKRSEVDLLIDLSGIGGLDGTELVEGVEGTELVLGPLMTHAQAAASPLVIEHALALAQACIEVGSPQIRNRATIVGNLITASPANDTISAAFVLDARLDILSSDGVRSQLPVTELYREFRQTNLGPTDVVCGIRLRVPAPESGARRASLFAKVGLRRSQAISVVHGAVAARFPADQGSVRDLRLSLGSVGPTVMMVPGVRDLVEGRELDEALIAEVAAVAASACSPIDDLRATARYRSDSVEVVVRRMLTALSQGREREMWRGDSPRLWGRVPNGHFATSGSIGDQTGPVEINVKVNGTEVVAQAGPGETLLSWLRGQEALTGTKEGCAEGECGACTVRLDGIAVVSCLVLARRVHSAEVVTIEGLAGAEGALSPLQASMTVCGGVQCGFCTPGFVVAADTLLAEVADPDEDQIRAGLAGNLCRCTGYEPIIEAVRSASESGSRP